MDAVKIGGSVPKDTESLAKMEINVFLRPLNPVNFCTKLNIKAKKKTMMNFKL